MKTKRTASFIFIAFWACVGTEVAAQGLPAPLQECIAEKEDAKRLACFDRESARLAPQSTERTAATAATATGIATAPVQAAKPRTDEENFGYRGKLAREEADRKATETHALEQLTATVVGIRTRPHGEFVVTLNNGQEWAQKDGEKSMRLNLGDTVTIKPGSLGAFFSFGRDQQVVARFQSEMNSVQKLPFVALRKVRNEQPKTSPSVVTRSG